MKHDELYRPFHYGDIGFEADGEFAIQTDEERAAVEHSVVMADSAIAARDEHDDVLSVAIRGQIFRKLARTNNRKQSQCGSL